VARRAREIGESESHVVGRQDQNATVTVELYVSSPMVFLTDDEHHHCLGTPRRREHLRSPTAANMLFVCLKSHD